MKESFGFIERADVVREIFFHYSEFKGNINELLLGDDVEFNVQTRNVSFVCTNVSVFFSAVVGAWASLCQKWSRCLSWSGYVLCR